MSGNVRKCPEMSGNVGVRSGGGTSENVKITRAETMSQNFRHIVISTHKSVEMCRAETMCTFSLRKKFVKKCDIQTDGQTDTQTDRQSLLEDASRIKNHQIKTECATSDKL